MVSGIQVEGDIMKETIDVKTGEVHSMRENGVLATAAIGSCIAVSAFDKKSRIGALAHVMLPGWAPTGSPDPFRYAQNALDETVRLMEAHGADKPAIQLCIAGGANVLERPDDTICELNISSVTQAARRNGLMILARSLRGTSRRKIRFELESGSVYCAVGDEMEKLLWRWRAL